MTYLNAKEYLDGITESEDWFVLDQRASTLRQQGWTGPAHDVILISAYPPEEITPQHCDAIVARVSLLNREEELGDYNFAHAKLIAAAPRLARQHAAMADEIARLREALKQIAGGHIPHGGEMAINGRWHDLFDAVQSIARTALSADRGDEG